MRAKSEMIVHEVLEGLGLDSHSVFARQILSSEMPISEGR
jgi:hypothetical protein